MKAKDTYHFNNNYWDEGGGYMREAIIEQAEISFKAGIKEVLEFLAVQETSHNGITRRVIIWEETWQNKLKEWEV